MNTLLIFFHIIICMLLITIVLMQAGRRGGLTESMVAAESMFGAHTNVFMVKATTIFACLFIATSLILAFFSAKKEKSLMTQAVAAQMPKQETLPILPDQEKSPLPIVNSENTADMPKP